MEKENSQVSAGQRGLNFFHTSAFLAVIIGIPFCTFKLLFGALAVRHGGQYHHTLVTILGWIVIGWAVIDIGMNLVRIYLNLRHRGPLIEFCIIAQLGRLFNRPSLFLTIDTFISFTIICFVLWSGWIADLRPFELYLWIGATTVNLLGLSLVNIWTELWVNSDHRQSLVPQQEMSPDLKEEQNRP